MHPSLMLSLRCVQVLDVVLCCQFDVSGPTSFTQFLYSLPAALVRHTVASQRLHITPLSLSNFVCIFSCISQLFNILELTTQTQTTSVCIEKKRPNSTNNSPTYQSGASSGFNWPLIVCNTSVCSDINYSLLSRNEQCHFSYWVFPSSLSLQMCDNRPDVVPSLQSGDHILLGGFFHAKIAFRNLSAITHKSPAKFFTAVSGCNYRSVLKLTHGQFFLYRGSELNENKDKPDMHIFFLYQTYVAPKCMHCSALMGTL